MTKFLGIFVLALVLVTAHGFNDNEKSMRNKMKEQLLKEEEMNSIDLGTPTEIKQSKFNDDFEEEAFHPKKFTHKKKGNKKHQTLGQDNLDEHHSQILGHRGEQKWREVQNNKNKQRIDPEEDLHLQDLSYQDHRIGDENRKEEGEKDFYKKKHNKDKKKEKKMNKEKKELKRKQKKEKKDKENKYKNKKNFSFEQENKP